MLFAGGATGAADFETNVTLANGLLFGAVLLLVLDAADAPAAAEKPLIPPKGLVKDGSLENGGSAGLGGAGAALPPPALHLLP